MSKRSRARGERERERTIVAYAATALRMTYVRGGVSPLLRDKARRDRGGCRENNEYHYNYARPKAVDARETTLQTTRQTQGLRSEVV